MSGFDHILPSADPEQLGIPASAIASFLDLVEKKRIPMHGFILMRYGQIAAETYWPPFHRDRLHRMYSVSKSFTAVAIGLLIDDGKINLQDPVANYFPEYLPEKPHRYVSEVTVRDLLMMATHLEGTSYRYGDEHFVRSFFQDQRPKHKPGAVFHYDTSATTVLCAIVEKVAGQKICEYMRPLFDKLGISEGVWCIETPEGGSWTGSGIMATTLDLAKFAQFCLQAGRWNSEQLVSEWYMKEACSRQIDTTVGRMDPGIAHGYGYQFWMLKDGGFACFGMGSQFAFIMPRQQAILVTTCDSQAQSGVQDILIDAFYDLLDQMSDEALDVDAVSAADLKRKLENRTFVLPEGKLSSRVAERFNNLTYIFEENVHGWQTMRVEMQADQICLHYEKGHAVHQLTFGLGAYVQQSFPEAYSGRRIGTLDRHYESMAAAAWANENSLIGTLYAIDDHIGVLKIQLTFYEDELIVYMTKHAEFFFDDYQGFLTGHREVFDR